MTTGGNMDLILEFFDISYYWKNDVPKIDLRLKEEKKIVNRPLLRSDNRPISGANEIYYVHYLGEIGKKVYEQRKKLFSKNKRIEWYINLFNPADKLKLFKHKNEISVKISKNLKAHYDSEAGKITKKKLKIRSEKNSIRIGEINSEKWRDSKWVAQEMKRRERNGLYEKVKIANIERMKDPEFVKKFKKACNSKERKEKISIASKRMWEFHRKNKTDKFYNMINSSKHKVFELNGYQMNSVEYLIGKLLNELELNWEYEKIFTFGKQTFKPDFFIHSLKLIVECYGDFWHANPLFFNENDLTHKTRHAHEIWGYDKKRMRLFENNGFDFIVFWEHEINDNIDKCKKQLNEIKNERK